MGTLSIVVAIVYGKNRTCANILLSESIVRSLQSSATDSQRIRILISKGSRENRMPEMSLACSRANLCSRFESTHECFSICHTHVVHIYLMGRCGLNTRQSALTHSLAPRSFQHMQGEPGTQNHVRHIINFFGT